MNELDRYIDRLFRGAERTRETRELKERISESAREQYEALLAEGTDEKEALSRVLADIGTREDLLREYPPRNTVLNALALVFLVLFSAGAVYAAYCSKNAAHWRAYYRVMPLYVFQFLVKPGMFLCGAYLFLFAAGKITPSLRRLAVGKKSVRIALLVISLGFLCFYYSVMANVFLNFIQVSLSQTALFLSSIGGYPFLLLGALLYFGVKK